MTEIGVLALLAANPHRYILNLVAALQDDSYTYLVTEDCEGGEVFNRVSTGPPLTEAQVCRYFRQLLLAVQHLHTLNIGHRDISLENILLRNNEFRLMDFGQAVRIRTEDGVTLRYFAPAGKDKYRAPEMYCPSGLKPLYVTCPDDARPGDVVQVLEDGRQCEVLLPADAVPGGTCMAEPYGYAVPPSDVFACGVCVFVLAFQVQPWKHAQFADKNFDFVHRDQNGIEGLLGFWHKPLLSEAAMALLIRMLNVKPTERPSVEECLESDWLRVPTIATPHAAVGEMPAPRRLHEHSSAPVQ